MEGPNLETIRSYQDAATRNTIKRLEEAVDEEGLELDVDLQDVKKDLLTGAPTEVLSVESVVSDVPSVEDSKKGKK